MYGESIDSLEDLEFKKIPTPALAGGFALELSFTETFAIQPEIFLSMQGTEFTKKVGTMQDQMDVEYLYLTVPILLKKKFPMRNMEWSLFVGPAPSVNLSSNFEMSLEGTDDPDTEYDLEFETKEITEKTDFGVVVGTEAKFPLGKGEILVDLRHTLGLKEITLYHDIEGTHAVTTLMVGYCFRLK